VGLGAGGDVAPPRGGTTRLLERSHTVQPAQAVQMDHRTRTYRMAAVTKKVLRYFVCPIRRGGNTLHFTWTGTSQVTCYAMLFGGVDTGAGPPPYVYNSNYK
jgi:hypothetical protein